MTFKEYILQGISDYYEGKSVEFDLGKTTLIFDNKNAYIGKYLYYYNKEYSILQVSKFFHCKSLSEIMKIIEDFENEP